ncbi:MAG: hypothetical protein MUO85_06240, partial [candidate division Zixibacteria bacterium]|nr:hypothetical protein [candidate division Zixibacteria bacterium]
LFLGFMISLLFYPSAQADCLESEKLLPEIIGGWRACDSSSCYDRESLFDYIDGGAEIYLAYDFKTLTVQKYCRDTTEITVEIYQTETPEDAFGLYSQSPLKRNITFTQRGGYNSGELRFRKGAYFVRIFSWKEKDNLKKDILELGRRIADKIKGKEELPVLFCALPKLGLVPQSECYLHQQISLNKIGFISNQNILNLNSKTNAVIADYRVQGDSLKYLLIQYSNGVEAERAWQSFNRSYAKGKLKPYSNVVGLENGEFIGVFLIKRYLGIILQGKKKGGALYLLGLSQSELGQALREKKLPLKGVTN